MGWAWELEEVWTLGQVWVSQEVVEVEDEVPTVWEACELGCEWEAALCVSLLAVCERSAAAHKHARSHGWRRPALRNSFLTYRVHSRFYSRPQWFGRMLLNPLESFVDFNNSHTDLHLSRSWLQIRNLGLWDITADSRGLESTFQTLGRRLKKTVEQTHTHIICTHKDSGSHPRPQLPPTRSQL